MARVGTIKWHDFGGVFVAASSSVRENQMPNNRSKARARALRVAQVVTIAGAMLGFGCDDSVTGGDVDVPDSNVPDSDVLDSDIIPDANIPDAHILPDAEVVDGSVVCPRFSYSGFMMCAIPGREECSPMTAQCCSENAGRYNESINECCARTCPVGPLTPPELMV